MTAYYNEIEPAAAHVLRALIAANVIAPGEVDERSIHDVRPDELRGFTQCHFFAGGGLWSVAARLAGWPDDRPLWTGSCPCQPFSVAGKGAGASDPRHLWPDFFRLIGSCRPPVVVGEQVAGSAGYGWFDGVSADLEGEGYASRAVDIPACAVDAPHIRQRLYWVAMADADGAKPRFGQFGFQQIGGGRDRAATEQERAASFMGHAESLGRGGRQDDEDGRRRECAPADTGAGGGSLGHADAQGRLQPQGPVAKFGRWTGDAGARHDMGYAESLGRRGRQDDEDRRRRECAPADTGAGERAVVDADSAGRIEHGGSIAVRPEFASSERAGSAFGPVVDASGERRGEGRPEHGVRSGWPAPASASFWSDAELRLGADGKARRVKPGIRLLVDGLPGRVAQLRIGGNAIVPEIAAQVLAALMDVSS